MKELWIVEQGLALGSAGITVASFGYKSTNAKGLVGKLAIDAKAARH